MVLGMTRKAKSPVAAAVATAAAALGAGFGALLLAGGLRVAADPELRPPRLPNRRPARWVLPSVGGAWLLATAGTARVWWAPRRSGIGAARFLAAPVLAGLAMPGAAAIVFEVARLRSAAKKPTVPARTVIVLGCALKNDKPSELLVRRLRRAVAACDSSTERIICCGGFGSEAVTDATISEAAAMVDWLVRHAGDVVKRSDAGGARAIKLVEEDQSTNTSENLQFAADLMADAGALAGGTVVVTSDFHVPRVAKLVRELGLPGWCVVGAYSPVRYWATSTLREFLAQFVLWAPGGNGRILRISRVRGGSSH